MYDLLNLVIYQGFTCNNWLYPNNSLKRQILLSSSFYRLRHRYKWDSTRQYHRTLVPLLLPDAGLLRILSTHMPPLAIHVTYRWPWLCLRPAGHARQSCHLPEVWSILASSSFWISPCASAYLSASAAHLEWWVALGQEKQGLDSQPGIWRTQEELLNKGFSILPVPGLSPQALFCRGTHGLAAKMPSPTAPPAGTRVT